MIAWAIADSLLRGRLSVVENVRLIIGSSGSFGSRFPYPFILLALLGSGRLTSGRNIALRHLRVLPFATWELNGLMLAGSSAFWLAVWLARSAAGLLLLGQAPTLSGVDLLIGLAGLTCLSDSATLRWKDRGLYSVLALLVMVPLVLILLGGRFNPLTIEVPRMVFGLGCMGAAALWNHHTLTTCSTIYKQRETAFQLIASK